MDEGRLMEFRRLRVLSTSIGLSALAACGGGAQTVSAPSAKSISSDAPRSVSERARRFTAAMSAAKSVSVDARIEQEAAKGARVFRVDQVAVIGPVTRAQYIALRDQVKQTADGIVMFPGPAQIVLSNQARIVTTNSHGYLFRHGAEPDPDASVHAVRVR